MEARDAQRIPQFVQTIVVRGLRIAKVHRAKGERIAAPDEQSDGGKILEFEDAQNQSFPAQRAEVALVAKREPRPGDYWVLPREGPVEIMRAEEFHRLFVPMAHLQAPSGPWPGSVEYCGAQAVAGAQAATEANKNLAEGLQQTPAETGPPEEDEGDEGEKDDDRDGDVPVAAGASL